MKNHDGSLSFSTKTTAANIVGKWEFVLPSDLTAEGRTFVSFYNYTSRKDAVDDLMPKESAQNEGFVGYTSRDKATKLEPGVDRQLTPTFDDKHLNMSQNDVSELKDKLRQAFHDQTPLTTVPFSFDTNFLVDQGYYDPTNGILDQAKLKTAFQSAMPILKDKMGLNDSFFWWGDIHVNTQHVHGHLSFSETNSDRPLVLNPNTQEYDRKGYIPGPVVSQFKSALYHSLTNEQTRTREFEIERDLADVRRELIDKYRNDLNSVDDPNRPRIAELYRALPENKQLWTYKHRGQSMQEAQKLAKGIIDDYLRGSQKDDYQKFLSSAQKLDHEFAVAYGTSNAGQVLKKRDDELRERLTNSLFRNLKGMDKNDVVIDFSKLKNASSKDISDLDSSLWADFDEEDFNKIRVPRTQQQFSKMGNAVEKLPNEKMREAQLAKMVAGFSGSDEEKATIERELLAERNVITSFEDRENSPVMNVKKIEFLKKQMEMPGKNQQEENRLRSLLIQHRVLVKQQNLRLQDAALVDQGRDIDTIGVVDSNLSELVKFKLNEVHERQDFVHLQQISPFKLTETQRQTFLKLDNKYINSVNISIDSITYDNVMAHNQRLTAEQKLLSKVDMTKENQVALKRLGYSSGVVSEEVAKLDAKKEVVRLKLDIKDKTNRDARRGMYGQLKDLYMKVDPQRDQQAVHSIRSVNFRAMHHASSNHRQLPGMNSSLKTPTRRAVFQVLANLEHVDDGQARAAQLRRRELAKENRDEKTK